MLVWTCQSINQEPFYFRMDSVVHFLVYHDVWNVVLVMVTSLQTDIADSLNLGSKLSSHYIYYYHDDNMCCVVGFISLKVQSQDYQ